MDIGPFLVANTQAPSARRRSVQVDRPFPPEKKIHSFYRVIDPKADAQFRKSNAYLNRSECRRISAVNAPAERNQSVKLARVWFPRYRPAMKAPVANSAAAVMPF
jgi:hypothetical protein